MTTKCLLKIIFFTAAVLSASGVSAYTDDKDKPLCKTPKFRDFNLPVYSAENKTEVAPGSEMSFTVSNWINPDTIVVTAKDVTLEVNVENKNSFFRVSAKLPASLNGKFARINARVDALLGCKGAEGWLIKIADVQNIKVPEENPETKAGQDLEQPAANAEEGKDGKAGVPVSK